MIDNQYWKDRAIQLEKQTHQSSKKSYQKLIPVFNKAQKEIQNKIDLWITRIANNNEVSLDRAKEMLDNKELKDFKMSLTEYINYGMDNALNQRWMKELENASARVHIDRLEQLKLNIQAEAMKLFGTEDKTLTDSIKEAYNERYDINNYIVQKGLGIGFDVASIDQDKLDKLISKPWASDGRNFSNRLWQSKEQMVNNLYNQTVRLSLGGSLKDAIDSMTRYVGREIKNKKYAAQRLIQTEMSYFTSEAQKESYKELGLDKYEIVATLDNKTSSICQEMDGKVYDMEAYQSGITAPPFHPNCRSTTCPYFDDEFTVREMRKAKDLEGKTFKVPATMSYREWKVEQEENSFKLRNNLPKDYVDTRQIGEKISQDTLDKFINYANSKNIQIGTIDNKSGGFDDYCGDIKVLYEYIDILNDYKFNKVILKYDNVLDRGNIDIGAFAETKGNTIMLNKFMYDDTDFMKKAYKDAVDAGMFVKGSTYKNVIDHEAMHLKSMKKIAKKIVDKFIEKNNKKSYNINKIIIIDVSKYAKTYDSLKNEYLELGSELNVLKNVNIDKYKRLLEE